MSRRLPEEERRLRQINRAILKTPVEGKFELPKIKGVVNKYTTVYGFEFKNYYIEYQWQLTADVYLISIFDKKVLIMELLISLEDLKGKNIVDFIKDVIRELYRVRDDIEKQIKDFYLLNDISKEQLDSFRELLKRDLLK